MKQSSTSQTVLPNARRGGVVETNEKQRDQTARLLNIAKNNQEYSNEIVQSLQKIELTLTKVTDPEIQSEPSQFLKEVESITTHASKLGATELIRSSYKLLISIQNNKTEEVPKLIKEASLLFFSLKGRLAV